jgi:15-cis-phytoene synthase/lycopene beta-cyclase
LALALNLVTRPIQTQRQQNRTRLLVAIAVISTIPWDSYLIQRGIWSYPPEAVFGWTLWKIPLEEVFFFVIQTYITSSLYSVLSRPVVHAALLRKPHSVDRLLQWLGTGLLTSAIVWAFVKLYQGGECTYLALIAAWACPFLLMLWALSWIHIVSLPFYATILPIALSTAYFWLVDTVALKRGTWVIEKGTKLELFLWKDLDLECVKPIASCMGLFDAQPQRSRLLPLDQCLDRVWQRHLVRSSSLSLVTTQTKNSDFVWAIHDAWPEQYGRRSPGAIPPLSSLVRSLAVPYSPAMLNRLEELQKALRILKDKSKSFYTASMLFEGRMRLDLLSLYAVCREADDLVDEATDRDQIEKRLSFLRQQLLFENAQTPTAFPLLSGLRLPARPFEELIAGFEMDSDFAIGRLPIQTRNHLSMYAERVASSVAEMCVLLAWQHYGSQGISKEQQGHIVASARSMGQFAPTARQGHFAHLMDRSRFAVRQHCSGCARRPSKRPNLSAWRTTLRSDSNQLRSFHARPSSPSGPSRRARCPLSGCHQALTSRNARRDASCLCRLPGHRTAGAHASGRRGGDGKGAVLKTPAARYRLEGLLQNLEFNI